jgi:predicted nucleic acid-binding protein
MAAVASYLAETSALARLRHGQVAAVLGPLIEAGLVATCGVIQFELGWATRSAKEFDDLRADREAGYEWLSTYDEDWRRALAVQGALWRSGRVRAVGQGRQSGVRGQATWASLRPLLNAAPRTSRG